VTSIDFPSVRAGIANVLSTIPELKRVYPYTVKGEARNNAPYAHIYRGTILGPGITLAGEEVGDEGLGQYSHLVAWTIEIYAAIRSQPDAQQYDDLFSMRLLDAFNSNRLIDPNGPGVVDSSRLVEIDPFMKAEDMPLWVTVATLQTKIISSL
jgi:hypothetical protein